MLSPFNWAWVAANSAATPPVFTTVDRDLEAVEDVEDLDVFADFAALAAGFAFSAAVFFAAGFAGLVLELRAAVAFDAATVALDRAFKNGWAAYG